MTKVKDIVKFLLERYPLEFASDFDIGKIGLQFGDPEKKVSKVMIALDGTEDTIKQAIDASCEMVVLHHPFMFNPLVNMNYNSWAVNKLLMVIDNRLNVFAMHTNFDVASNGMNDVLASKLGLKNIKVLGDEINKDSLMRVGDIEPCTLLELAKRCKTNLGEDSVRVVGNLKKKIKSVGIIGGGGSFMTPLAIKSNIDCFISGEFRHNNALDAISAGFSLIEASHFVENNFKDYIKNLLQDNFPDCEFILAKETNPFKTI